ncbi:hypothetical protein J3458_019028 [Metarhizium acridum]|uniref:uncharacterized protein n=1 Tax=Metarhizium acridum TaxID=92637 RepID=UPI001C6AF539|nr:hypothetical protein J3458_019028 [Metarhizium acridum]
MPPTCCNPNATPIVNGGAVGDASGPLAAFGGTPPPTSPPGAESTESSRNTLACKQFGYISASLFSSNPNSSIEYLPTEILKHPLSLNISIDPRQWHSRPPSSTPHKLQGRRVLVLGGSSGIGFCIAEAAVEHGAFVNVSSSNQSKLDYAVSRLQSHATAVGVSPGDTLGQNINDLLEFATKNGKLGHVAFTAGDLSSYPSWTT